MRYLGLFVIVRVDRQDIYIIQKLHNSERTMNDFRGHWSLTYRLEKEKTKQWR